MSKLGGFFAKAWGGGAQGVSPKSAKKVKEPEQFNGVLTLDGADYARFEECMKNPGEPTEAIEKGAELLKKLYG